MDELRAQVALLGPRNCTVLIYGESGTGKELLARHIHAASGRASGPFIAVDCTTLHDSLFESQLFGHVRGAFTGAEHATLGLFRAAHGGTLLLDEVGELSARHQAKLLRCIQERAVTPVGGVEPMATDVRLLAATHRDLEQLVREGTFREDLYFRLNVVRICLPALRSRPVDILPLAEHFLAEQARIYNEPAKYLTLDARQALRAHAWPGNVRELRNVIEGAFALVPHDQISVGDLPDSVGGAARHSPGRDGDASALMPLEVAERRLVFRTLQYTCGNQSRAAELLGVERHRLRRMIRRHGLEHILCGELGSQSTSITAV